MESTDEVQRIVERYLLSPGETVTAVDVGSAATLITTDSGGWSVRRLDRARNFTRSAGYVLYDIAPALVSDPPGRSEGVAIVPDGRTFHLNNPGGFRAFFAAVRAQLQPLELATLLTLYQSDLPGAESVVADYDHLAWLFPGAQPAAIPAMALPETEGTPAGVFAMRYGTLYLADDPADRFTKVNLNRWQIAATPDGPLTWSAEPLARNLDSPRYRP